MVPYEPIITLSLNFATAFRHYCYYLCLCDTSSPNAAKRGFWWSSSRL